MTETAKAPLSSADGSVWLYTAGRAVRSMGAASVWTRHLFVNGGSSACSAVTLSRLQRGYSEPGQGASRTCKRCKQREHEFVS